MPTAPRLDADAWERTGERTEVVFASSVVTVRSTTAAYEHSTVSERLEEYTPTSVDKTPDALLDIAARYAAREFEQRLGEDGLEDVERTGAQELRLPGRSQPRPGASSSHAFARRPGELPGPNAVGSRAATTVSPYRRETTSLPV